MTIAIFNMFRKLLNPPPRGEIRLVDYAEGDKLIRTGEWKLAIPEEDNNHVFYKVWLEKVIKP